MKTRREFLHQIVGSMFVAPHLIRIFSLSASTEGVERVAYLYNMEDEKVTKGLPVHLKMVGDKTLTDRVLEWECDSVSMNYKGICVKDPLTDREKRSDFIGGYRTLMFGDVIRVTVKYDMNKTKEKV